MRRALAALALAAPIATGGELELVSIQPHGDPIALATNEATTAMVVVDGCAVSVRALLGAPPWVSDPLREGVFDATVLGLAIAGDDLFVAAGEAGLWRAAWREPGLPRLPVPALPAGVCTAVAATRTRVFAGWLTPIGARLLVLERPSLALRYDCALDAARAWRIAAEGDERVWIAAGHDGLLRVDLPGSPEVVPEPVRVVGDAGFVRDVARSDDGVVAAADSRLVRVLRGAAPIVLPAPGGERAPYVVRVAADDARVYAGCLRAPGEVAEGAPYGLTGAIGLDLEIGAIAPDSFALGAGEALAFARASDLEDVWHRRELPLAGFRDLAAGNGRLVGQLLRLGTCVWRVEGDELVDSWSERPAGHPWIDGAFSLADPNVVLFGTDSQGALVRGVLELDERARFRVRPGTEAMPSLGLRVGAQWLDDEGAEWFVAGLPAGWQLVRFAPGAEAEWTRWPLALPKDEAGQQGTAYFASALAGELVLGTRAGSRYGLVAWERAALVAAARSNAAGTTLDVACRFQVRTAGAHLDPERCVAWDAVPFEAGGERCVLVPAARDASGGTLTRVYALAPGAPPAVCPPLLGGGRAGHATCAAVAHVAGRVFAAVGDLGGSVQLFDVTSPRHALRLPAWRVPASVYDGRPDAVLDLAFVGEGDATELLVAAGRAGLLRLTLDAASGLALAERLDTPGWAVGLAVAPVDGAWRVLVGDQKCGGRLYRWTPDPQKRK
ncbi:MAG: hypothetical protein H6828_02060 [Planctomycetes bacterium]|nr:hypothetical protein [Planctomycetota bacterium]